MKEKSKPKSGKYIWLVLGVVVILGAAAGSVFYLMRDAPPSGESAREIPLDVSTTSESDVKGVIEMTDSIEGSFIQLSEGSPQPQESQPSPLVNGERLTEEEVQQILARLPILPGEPADQVDFKLAGDPIPPPRTGETVAEAFPPPAPEPIQPEVDGVEPLQVLRFAPEGEIPIAPFVSVTFNQPMVALSTLENLATEQVPVKLEPSLPGTWRWIGTKALTFQYDSELIDRLPKATVYTVTVPAGTRSAVGGVLAETVSWTFSTPPPRVTTTYPYDAPQPLEPVFFVAFDQRIKPEAVFETVRVLAGDQSVSLKLAGEDELEKDIQVKNLVKHAVEGRWLAFVAKEPLPADTQITVEIGPQTPSAEGPLLTQDIQRYGFHTYAPLRIEEHGCSWGQQECRPLTPFYISFNNPIDADVYQESMLRIEPELPGALVNILGNTIQISGASQGRTTYWVTVDGEIQDIFGQQLGENAQLSFRVSSAESSLVGPGEMFVTLDPALKNPELSLYVINHNKLGVRIYAVQPSDWFAYKEYLRNFQRTDVPHTPPGNLVLDETLSIDAPPDKLSEVSINLKQVMDGNFGHFIVIAEPPKSFFKNQSDRYWQTVQVWVQVTQIGLDAFNDHSELVVWATALKDGAPLGGVEIASDTGNIVTVTKEDGTARVPIPDGANYLVASQGTDHAMLPRSRYMWDSDAWSRRTVNDELRWYVFDDRQMYRPGEEVHIKGWLRLIGGKQSGGVGMVGEKLTSVNYRLMDPQGNDLSGGEALVNALGGFDFTFKLPEQVNLGYAWLDLRANGNLPGLDGLQYSHGFQIQEFRRPEFEVTARNETTGPYFAGDHAILAVEAKYYAGGALPNAEVTWQVDSSPGNYSPPNWSDFTFGTWNPWWGYYSYANNEPWVGENQVYYGQTDAAGEHYLRLDFGQPAVPRPMSVLAQATVMDVNRQAWTGSTSLLVHPASLYVGLRSDEIFVDRGVPLKIDFIVTDLDGNPISDRPVKVEAARMTWKYRDGAWLEEAVDVQVCNLGSQPEPVTCTFETPLGGSYRITAQVTDELGRLNQSTFMRWVSGGERPPARKVEQESVILIPDKETYQPGDVARILVQSPFSPAEGLLTVSRSGILYTERFTIKEGTLTLEVPIKDEHIPNLSVQVDLVGSAPRSDDQGNPLEDVPARPAYASGQLDLSIPPANRTLTLQISPQQKELEPGGETTIDLELKDAQGRPVPGAELAVVVVDEAILALTNYQLTDPLDIFYTPRWGDLAAIYGRASLILADPQSLMLASRDVEMQVMSTSVVQESLVMEAPAGAPAPMEEAESKGGGGGTETPIRVRMDFNPLATFAPEVPTDANGKAQVVVKLPDNLTRYRVMVVAVDQPVDARAQFGMAETNLVARLPLMVRPSAPRFLNFGDSFELPVVLQNQTDQPMQVDVVLQVSNLKLTAGSGLTVAVPARERVEVRFPAQTDRAGTARFQVAAVSGDYADAATVELPVYTPATSEAFATYGVVDNAPGGQTNAVFQPVASPTGVFPQYGGLEINTSSTALQALTDAVLYLVAYPFECSEQLASRILAVSALRDVLSAFEADGLPSPQELEAAVERDIKTLQGVQNYDGGFPYWRRGFESIPFNTIHVAHALQRAEQMGFEVPVEMRQQVLVYLQEIESHYPSWYGQQTRQTLSAYALYVRNLMGDRDPPKAQRLLAEAGLEKLSMEAIGWLWQVLLDAPGTSQDVEAIRSFVNNRVVETPGAANFTTSYDDQTYLLLSSDRRTDAILLDAMIGDDPQHDLIPKLVNGLLAHRTKGRWGNTQENVFVLLALDRYFKTYESQAPDFVARIWLGDTYAGDHTYSGYSTERHETKIPMSYLVDESLGGGETQNLIISKEGPGRLYYRLGLRYAPDDLKLDPLDMGFVVQRQYEGVDDPGDVTQDVDGTWHIKAGSRVRVRLSMVADNRRYHVALVDPLPAGLEIVNPALAVSGSTPQDPASTPRYGWWWWGTWYEHQNLRDERAEAFTSLLWDGIYEYTYITRATTPGRFIVPPARAEEMYSPEVFGRSGSDWVIVEDR